MVQLSHLYMTTGETSGLSIWTFVSRGMSLLFNMLSTFVVAFLPRSKHEHYEERMVAIIFVSVTIAL